MLVFELSAITLILTLSILTVPLYVCVLSCDSVCVNIGGAHWEPLFYCPAAASAHNTAGCGLTNIKGLTDQEFSKVLNSVELSE